MSLTLTVLSFKNRSISEINTVSIGNDGGSIGRSDDNTLVLPDTEKFVSRHHATVKVENGCYYLTDTSLSGVIINDEQPPLNNATQRLDNGTRLKIGEYEIAVAIVDESVMDDFPFISEPITPMPSAFLAVDEPWVESDQMASNSLMTDNFPSHDELIQQDANARPADFQSHLLGNQSPLFDSYTAPSIVSSSSNHEIPENFSFDDLFPDHDVESQQNLTTNKPTVSDDFEDFFGAAISDMAGEMNQPALISEIPTENNTSSAVAVDSTSASTPAMSEAHKDKDWTEKENPLLAIEQPFFVNVDTPAISITESETHPENNKTNTVPTAVAIEKTPSVLTDNVLFNAFLQGAAVECKGIHPERQAETLHRIGQMFRKLIDGTIAVLRSRAEFKSLCRVNMTVIKAANNNPLKFTVSTDDVLRQLLENKTDGFLASTVAIEEAFNDIMNHQLAMQAGIQASLTDLLKTFDPKVIEKEFEQGLVLQKKSKCWDQYEATYRITVEDAVENFFGEAFVKAYEKQMDLLIKSRGR